jgi:alpha/beta superfamily hydrolase
MEPFYFGSHNRQLFGAYHTPVGASKSEGVVICPPLFAEFLRCHTCLRRIAEQLSEIGYDVLRFDYFGTGDSAGRFDETDVHGSLDDIEAAISELVAISGARKISLIGVRFGATLATRVALGRQIARLILWDPIVEGASYLEQLRRTHERLLAAHRNVFGGEADLDSGDTRELVGYPVSAQLLASIEAMTLPNLRELRRNSGPSVTAILSQENHGDRNWIENARQSEIGVSLIDFDCDWSTFKESVLFPQEIVTAVCDAM